MLVAGCGSDVSRIAVFSGSIASPQLPYWSLKLALDEVAVGASVSLPSTSAEVFVADVDPPAGNGNEASSNVGGSSGTIQLRDSSCAVGGWVSVDFNALLASEVGLAAIAVTGTFRDTITSAPP